MIQIKTFVSLILFGVFINNGVQAQNQKPDWNIDGKKNFVSLAVVMMNPISPDFEFLGFTGGPRLSISRITGRKTEWGFSVYGGGINYEPKVDEFGQNLSSKNFEKTSDAKGLELQFELGIKRYFHRNGRNFAPLGGYYRLALSVNSYNITTPAYVGVENRAEVFPAVEFGTTAPGFVFGLGRDFRLSDRLFMGLGARANLFFTDEPDLSYSSRMSFLTYNFNRNYVIADYTFRYLF